MSATAPTVSAALGFQDVVQFLLADKRIARLEWTDPEVYCELRGEQLMIHLQAPDDQHATWHPWVLSRGDLDATDWVVL